MDKMSEKESKFEETLNEITECSICREIFTEPKLLACAHTFCKKCLQELANKLEKSEGAEIPCPICRKIFTIPDGGFEKFTRNFLVEKLIDARNALVASSTNPVFETGQQKDSSGDEIDNHFDKLYCRTCQQTAILEERSVSKADMERLHGEYHEKHPDISLSRSNCPKDICPACSARGHDFLNVPTNVFECEVRRKLEDNLDKLSDFGPQLQKKIQKLEDDKMNFLRNLSDLEIEINRVKEEFKAKIEDGSQALLSELNLTHEVSLKNFSIIKNETESDLIELESLKEYYKPIMDLKSHGSILEIIECLNSKACELQNKCQLLEQRTCNFPQLALKRSLQLEERFAIGTLREICSGNELKVEDSNDEEEEADFVSACSDSDLEFASNVGKSKQRVVSELRDMIIFKANRIQELEEAERISNEKLKDFQQQIDLLRGIAFGENSSGQGPGSVNYMVKPKSICKLDSISLSKSKPWKVLGFAILSKEFYIVVESKELVVEIYDRKTLQFRRRWISRRLVNVKDVKICEISRRLYFMNATAKRSKSKAGGGNKQNEILAFDPHGNVINFWLVNDSIGQLSITNEANILFTIWNKGQLQEYSPDGQLIRAIALLWDYGFEHPWHAIKVNSSYYLVAHGSEDDQLQRLCLIDSHGKIFRSTENMKCPVYMDTDADGNVIVADGELCRLQIFSKTLKEINASFYISPSVIWSKKPQKVMVDQENRRMFVLQSHFNQRVRFESIKPSEKHDIVDILTLSLK